MHLDLTHAPDSLALHAADRAADELALEILALADSGVRFDAIDRAFGLAAGAALKIWFDVQEACGEEIAIH